jgi:glutathionyl-hydroquinone reductase
MEYRTHFNHLIIIWKELKMLVNGKWTKEWDPVQAKDEKGGFQRQQSGFRDWIGDEKFPAEAGVM